MKIMILNGSPRKNGNTSAFVEVFKEAAVAAGHEVEIAAIGNMKINGCIGCEFCHGKGEGKCVQKDDMDQVYAPLAAADLVVLASPVYYWGFTGQMQSVITRFYNTGKPVNATKYAMILSSGSPGVYDGIISQYNSILSYIKAENAGILLFDGYEQKCEENFEKIREFAKAL